ncbi:hypothetical protein [Pelosinus propionicus]|uniref:hypothetical protein n=1 Tax=Pelosinus propionicus TaxID=380084 RepID=UPI001113E9C4|nr:hypothetical protein [Pelosinus propionicus]
MQLWEGYQWRKKDSEDTMAYFAACQMSVHTKKPVEPRELLKPLRQTLEGKSKKEDEEYLKGVFKESV